MPLQTSFFEAVKVANYLQLAGRNVDVSLSQYFNQGEKLHLSLGQDDDWWFSDQEIEINESGEAQVRCSWGGIEETKPMRFLMSRPLNQDDLKNGAQA